MRVPDIRTGMRIDNLTIDTLARAGEWLTATLSDGSARRFHKTEHVAVTIPATGYMLAGPVRGPATPPAIRKVRAHHGVWRGENDGIRGERQTAKMPAWSLTHKDRDITIA